MPPRARARQLATAAAAREAAGTATGAPQNCRENTGLPSGITKKGSSQTKETYWRCFVALSHRGVVLARRGNGATARHAPGVDPTPDAHTIKIVWLSSKSALLPLSQGAGRPTLYPRGPSTNTLAPATLLETGECPNIPSAGYTGI